MDTRHRRRASVYLLVLSCALLVAIIGMSAVSAMRVRQHTVTSRAGFVAARYAAQSAIDLGLMQINASATWRADYAAGRWRSDVPLGDTLFTLHVTDPEDGDLADRPCDLVQLTGYGVAHDARYILRVLAEPDAVDFDPLWDVMTELKPLAYWRLGESDGKVAADVNGTLNGTYVNGVELDQQTPFRCDPAAAFDGVNDYVEIPHDDMLLIDEGSVSLWFNTHDRWDDQGLFSKDSSGHDDGGHFYIRTTGGYVEVRLQSDDHSYYVWYGLIVDRGWYHVVVTFGPGGMRLYLNGTYVDYEWYKGGWGASSGDDGNREPIAIGVNAYGSDDHSTTPWQEPFDGLIDEVAIFDYELSEEQVDELFDAGRQTMPTTVHVLEGSWERVVEAGAAQRVAEAPKALIP